MREMTEEHAPEITTPQRHLIESKVVQERIHIVRGPEKVKTIYECVKCHDGYPDVAIWHLCNQLLNLSVDFIIKETLWKTLAKQ